MRGRLLRGRSPSRADRHYVGHLLHHRMSGVGGNNHAGSFVHNL
ncbi:MAG TPA: hypothetical protein VG324_18365 [Blastocatellia bacterium]|nr:hypothetical protein [Blastocatellia bacterium]